MPGAGQRFRPGRISTVIGGGARLFGLDDEQCNDSLCVDSLRQRLRTSPVEALSMAGFPLVFLSHEVAHRLDSPASASGFCRPAARS